MRLLLNVYSLRNSSSNDSRSLRIDHSFPGSQSEPQEYVPSKFVNIFTEIMTMMNIEYSVIRKVLTV